MTTEQEIQKLKSDILFSDNWENKKASTNRIFEIGGQENIDYLLGLLEQSNSLVRNAVAMTFMEKRFNEGLEPLLNSITKAENRNERGTMVYALSTLDCSKKLNQLFDILFTATKNWEVQSAVLTVLEEQEFEFTEDDLNGIKGKWEKLRENWDELNNIEKIDTKKYQIDRDVIQNFVDGYISYLEKS